MKDNEIREFIDDSISSALMGSCEVKDRYHHNSEFENASSILKNGILSISDLHKLKIINCSLERLEILSDINSHINGIDGVSLAVVGLLDLYKDEDVFDPFSPTHVDFIVDDNVKAGRISTHYGNEFISPCSISKDKIKAVDVRLRKYLRLKNCDVNKLISYYESLRMIASTLKELSLDIPFRDMSDSNRCFDIEKVLKMPSIKR